MRGRRKGKKLAQKRMKTKARRRGQIRRRGHRQRQCHKKRRINSNSKDQVIRKARSTTSHTTSAIQGQPKAFYRRITYLFILFKKL